MTLDGVTSDLVLVRLFILTSTRIFFFRCIFYDILFSNREIYNLFFGALIVHLREIFGDIGRVYELFLGTSVVAKHFFKVTQPP